MSRPLSKRTASVVCHDSFWYPLIARRKMTVLTSDWGRLFRNRERLVADDNGFPNVGTEMARAPRTGLRAFLTSLRVLATCLREAPEFAARRSRIVKRPDSA
jgi:hypothetical protein